MEIVFGAKNGVRAFCDNSAESEPIWIKSGALSLWVKCRGLALADFGCDPRSRNSFRGRRDFVVFWSGTISPISRRTKFYDIWTQQRRSVRRWKLSEQKFENFTARSHFFKKTQTLLTKFPRLATSGRHNSAMINAGNSLNQSVPLLDVSFPFYR